MLQYNLTPKICSNTGLFQEERREKYGESHENLMTYTKIYEKCSLVKEYFYISCEIRRRRLVGPVGVIKIS